MATLPNLLNDNQNLRLEAYEAIKDVMFAIEKASVADDSNENTAYINLTTKEQDELTILLTVEGYKVHLIFKYFAFVEYFFIIESTYKKSCENIFSFEFLIKFVQVNIKNITLIFNKLTLAYR